MLTNCKRSEDKMILPKVIRWRLKRVFKSTLCRKEIGNEIVSLIR